MSVLRKVRITLYEGMTTVVYGIVKGLVAIREGWNKIKPYDGKLRLKPDDY